jgi:site-specific DNA recombinase
MPRTTKKPSSSSSSSSVKRAALYLRMSQDRTGEGAGLERQEEACRALALARGWEVVAVRQDTMSASTAKASQRPGWSQVLSLVEAGEVDVVLAWHLDRITRTMTDLEELILLAVDKGVGIATATGDIDLTTDSGRMVARILAAVARQEVERKAERQRLAAQQRAKAGRPQWSTRPFGYERDGSPREAEAAVVRKAYADVLDGRSLASVTADFNASGFSTTKAGQVRAADGSAYSGEWDTPTVRHILLNPRNAGISTYRGEEVGPGTWEPLVPEETFRAVVHTLTSPGRRKAGGFAADVNLLTGFATCGSCGSAVKAGWRGGRKGDPSAYLVYSCRRSGCVSHRADFVESVVLRRVVEALEEPTFWLRWMAPATDAGDPAALRAEEHSLRERLEALATDYADGLLSRSQMQAGTARLRERLEQIERELGLLGRSDVLAGLRDTEYVWQELDAMPTERLRAVVESVLESVELLPRGKGRRAQRAEDLRITLREPVEASA